MAEDGRVVFKAELEAGELEAGLSRVNQEFANAGKTSKDGFTVAKGVLSDLTSRGILAATRAVGDFAGGVVTVGSSFETAMDKVSALSGATGEELEKLANKARELGANTQFSATEAADALGYMALAGWDTKQSLEAVDSVLTLAQAGEMDLAAASDMVTDYLSAFGMEADEAGRMVDVLAYAQGNANTSAEGLGAAFKNCAANANAAGLDIETTTAAISMMANQGLKGQEAGTALNAVMRDMTNRMKDGAIAIGETSVAVMDADGNYRDFVDILADVEAATNGMGDAEKAAALQSTFTADSIKGLNLMLNSGSGELGGFREELYNSKDAAQIMADTMTDNLQGDLAELDSALQATQESLYSNLQEPARGIVDFLTNSAVPVLQGIIDNLPVVATLLGGVAAAVLICNAANMANAAATGVATAAQWLWNTALNANPIGIVIIAITALVAAILYLWNNCETFRNGVTAAFGVIKGGFDALVANFQFGFNLIRGVASGVASFLSDLFRDPFGTLRSAVTGIVEWVTSHFKLPSVQFPHIKLPHFNISGGDAPWGIMGQGTPPTISIDWYAKGGIFNSASIIGVGEAGPEAVVPLSGPNMQPFADEVARRMGISMQGDEATAVLYLILESLPGIIRGNVPDSIKVNSREFARLVRSVDA